MSTKSTGSKASYTRHSAEYKQVSLKLAIQICVAKAAKQLGLHEPQLYAWRKQSVHTQSVSAKGCCYDNACAESFFYSLKVGAIHSERFDTREAIRKTVFE